MEFFPEGEAGIVSDTRGLFSAACFYFLPLLPTSFLSSFFTWKKVRWLLAVLQGCPVHKDGDVTSIRELQPRLAGDWGKRSPCVLFGAGTPKSLAQAGGRWQLRLAAPDQWFSLTVLPVWDPSRCAGPGRRQYSFKSGSPVKGS